jgi:Uma2 family endonuclease
MVMSTLLPVDARIAERTLVLDPPLTDAELEELCRANDSVQIERTREGVIHMNPPAGGLTGNGNSEINWQLRNWWKQHRTGMVFDSNTGFYLPDTSMLSPDASYATPATLKGAAYDQLTGFPRFCPDFVIELLSETDRLPKTKKKMVRWLENGAKLAWLINPYAKNVHVYQPGVAPVIERGSAISGAGPVDGFVLDAAEVWRCYDV